MYFEIDSTFSQRIWVIKRHTQHDIAPLAKNRSKFTSSVTMVSRPSSSTWFIGLAYVASAKLLLEGFLDNLNRCSKFLEIALSLHSRQPFRVSCPPSVASRISSIPILIVPCAIQFAVTILMFGVVCPRFIETSLSSFRSFIKESLGIIFSPFRSHPFVVCNDLIVHDSILTQGAA